MSRWAELTVQDEGIGVTLYEERAGPGVTTVDETWLTDAEIDAIRAREHTDAAGDHIILDGETQHERD